MKSAAAEPHCLLYLSMLLQIAPFVRPLQAENFPVDLTHATIITSPLKLGSNSSELLVPDFSKPPICIYSLPLIPSWVLIDLGYVVSGLSQIRLFSDYYLENAHEMLTNVEINLAEYLPPSVIRDHNLFQGAYFSRCGSTGTVSKDTSNAVVDCEFPSSVRWILLKKEGQLHLCYVQVLQNSVKPQCFQSLSPQDPSYEKTKKGLSVFRSKKYVTYLECLQNCDTDRLCNAVAFMPLNHGTGICQLLRSTASAGGFICDDTCLLRVNRCHLGERIRVRTSSGDEIIRLDPLRNSSYAVSIEINGAVSCNTDRCGREAFFLTDSNGEVHYCGSIDSALYRVLVNVNIICKRPVKAPRLLILKTDSNDRHNVFRFNSIFIRILEDASLSLNLIYEFSTATGATASKSSTSFSPSTPPTSSPASSPSTTPGRTPSTDEARATTSPSLETSPTNTQSISGSSPRRSAKEDGKSVKAEGGRRGGGAMVTKASVPLPNTVASDSVTDTVRATRTQRPPTPTTGGGTPLSSIIDESELRPQENITPSIVDSINSTERTSSPFLWVIFLVFGTTLVLVTAVVVIITFIDGRRKMKQWDIPASSLCPPDNGSESVTMDTSMQMSTMRGASLTS